MLLKNYLTVSRYFEFCWTSNSAGLQDLFDVDAVHTHTHLNEPVPANCVKERKGVENIMSEYRAFFDVVDLNSTDLHNMTTYPESDNIVVEYSFYQKKTDDEAEFKIKQIFTLTSESKIGSILMEVEKNDVNALKYRNSHRFNDIRD